MEGTWSGSNNFSSHCTEWESERLQGLLIAMRKTTTNQAGHLSSISKLQDHHADSCLSSQILDLHSKSAQSLLAPLGSAEGFPSPVRIPTLMVFQERNFPPILVSVSSGNIGVLHSSKRCLEEPFEQRALLKGLTSCRKGRPDRPRKEAICPGAFCALRVAGPSLVQTRENGSSPPNPRLQFQS